MIIYTIIQPPFTLVFPEMSKRDLKAYNEWFHSIMPERLEILRMAIQSTSRHEHWISDYSPASLKMLGDWFGAQIETRARTTEEIARMQSGQKFPVGIQPEELTNRTFSLCFDVGMYFSQTLQKAHPSLRWFQPLGGKKFVHYGQPVLENFRFGYFNPVATVVSFAYGVARKYWPDPGEQLRVVYDKCSKSAY